METDGLGPFHGLNGVIIYLAKSAQYTHLSFRDSGLEVCLVIQYHCGAGAGS
jgi:hypothetical protein